MIVKLLTEHHLEFLSLKREAEQARLSLHMSKCHIVGNHVSRLVCLFHRAYACVACTACGARGQYNTEVSLLH